MSIIADLPCARLCWRFLTAYGRVGDLDRAFWGCRFFFLFFNGLLRIHRSSSPWAVKLRLSIAPQAGLRRAVAQPKDGRLTESVQPGRRRKPKAPAGIVHRVGHPPHNKFRAAANIPSFFGEGTQKTPVEVLFRQGSGDHPVFVVGGLRPILIVWCLGNRRGPRRFNSDVRLSTARDKPALRIARRASAISSGRIKRGSHDRRRDDRRSSSPLFAPKPADVPGFATKIDSHARYASVPA